MAQSPRSNEPIAIVGIGCRFPGGVRDAETFWRLLDGRVDAVAEVPAERFAIDALYDPRPGTPGRLVTRWGGFLHGVDRFDAGFFGVSPREATAMDPQQRLLLEVAWEAMDDAGLPVDALGRAPTGVFVGVITADYHDVAVRATDDLDIYVRMGTARSFLAGRVSYALGLSGPSLVVETECSSSLVALHLSCSSLWAGECEHAIAAGVNLVLEPEESVYFSRSGMLSPHGRCKFGDSDAKGFVRSDGVAALLLKPLSAALAHGDRIHALIRSTAVNSDGPSGGSIMTPSVSGQAAVLQRALDLAGLAPADIDYVEAHGTGTRVGDPIELGAIGAVYGRERTRPCLVGSVKSNIGHTEATAGLAGVIKAALSLQRGVIPPSVHVHAPSPDVPWHELDVAVVTEHTPWPETGRPARAAVSSFGLSGTNAHAILEAAPARANAAAPAFDAPPVRLLAVSARAPEALDRAADDLCQFISSGSASIADASYSSCVRRTHHDHRLVVTGRSGEDMAQALRAFLAGEPHPAVHRDTRVASPGRMVWVFPGQGSQWAGMARDLIRESSVFRATLAEIEDAMRPLVDWSLMAELGADSDHSRLGEINVMQPVLFSIQVALAALWRSWGVVPDAVIGHSMGEIAAAHVAGALSLEHALRIICGRSLLMRRMSGQGAMAAVELPLAGAERLIAPVADRVSVAVNNSPSSVVLSGAVDVLEDLLGTLRGRDVFCQWIKVDVASHSPQMDGLQGELLAALADVEPKQAAIPMVSTVTGQVCDGTELTARYWVDNLRKPVLFDGGVGALVRSGHGVFVELSPHPILVPAIRQHLQHHRAEALLIPSMRRDHDGPKAMMMALGMLHARGVAVDLGRALPPGGQFVRLPAYPWQRERYWVKERAGRRHRSRAPGQWPGEHLIAASPDRSHFFETELDPARDPHLGDHRVHGVTLVSAAACLDLVVDAAAAALGTSALVLEDIRFEQALPVSSADAHRVQIIVSGADSGRAGVQVFAMDRDAEPRRALTATVRAAAPAASAEPTIPAPASAMAADDHYRALARHGAEYGPSLRSVRTLARGRGVATAEIVIPAESAPAARRAAMVDGCIQVLVQSLLSLHDDAALALPVAASAVEIAADLPGACTATARITGQDRGGAIGDVTATDEHGRVLVRVRALCMQRMELGAAEARDGFYFQQRWEREALAGPRAVDGTWLVFCDSRGVGQALCRGIEERGGTCIAVRRGSAYEQGERVVVMDPRQPAHLAAVLEASGPVRHIVYLWALDAAATDELDTAALDASVDLVWSGALHLTQALAARDIHARLWLVTRGAHAVTPGDAAPAVAQAPLWGLGRVIAYEHPALGCTLVDLAADADVIPALCDELACDAPGDEVALRPDGRHVARIARLEVAATGARPVRGDATYLVTGGLGALGLHAARWLAERGARHIVLASRRPDPQHAAVAELARLGVEVEVAAVDVAAADDVARLIADISGRMPRLGGIIHAAGVRGDALLADLDRAGFVQMMAAKVHGAWNLHVHTAGLRLDFFVLYSSAVALLGPPGQGHYVAANAFLDALACHRRALGLPALAIGWGPWRDLGLMAGREGDVRRMDDRGLGAHDAARGVDALDQLMAVSAPAVAAMAFDAARWAGRHPSRWPLGRLADLGAASPGAAAPRAAGAVILAAGATERQGAICRYLRDLAAQSLRLGADRVPVERSLRSLGFDSLMAMDMKNRVELELGVRLPVSKILIEGANIEQLARHVDNCLPAAVMAAVAPAPERSAPFPLTPVQEAYWIGRSELYDSGGVSPQVYFELDARGLDHGRLERAWQRLIERHDMLRAVVAADGMQRVLADVPPYRIELEDLSSLPAPARDQRLAALRDQVWRRVLRADEWPLFDVRTARLGPDHLRVFFKIDLLIADGESIFLLMREWGEHYRDADHAPPPLATSFRDYVMAQQAERATSAFQESLAYWRERAATLPPAPVLPAAAPRAASSAGVRRRVTRLAADLWSLVRDRARQHDITPSALLCAVYAEALSRFAESPHLTLNLTVLTRRPYHPAVHDIVGDFTSLLLLEVHGLGSSFVDRARALQDRLTRDLDHAQVSGVEVMREIKRARGARDAVLMPFVFTSHLGHWYLGGGASSPMAWLGEEVHFATRTPQVWLDHIVFEEAGDLAVYWDGVDDRFPPGLIDDLCACYEAMLRRLADDQAAWHASGPLVALPPAQAEERARYNDTAEPLPRGLLHHGFLAQAERDPAATAVIAPGTRMSYGELRDRAWQLAHWLRSAGAGPGQLVAVVMDKGWEQVVAVLGILQAGAAYLPVDPALPAERLRYLLDSGQCAVAVTQQCWDTSLAWPASVRRVAVTAESLSAWPTEPFATTTGQRDLAYVIYTSGSTGKPKGVVIDHLGALNTIVDINQRFAVGPRDRVFAISALSFDLSVYDIFGALAAGAAMVMPRPGAVRDPGHWLDLITAERVTFWSSVPALAELLIEAAADREVSSLRLFLLSGDWIPTTLPDRLRARARNARVVSAGGATEGSIWSIYYPIGEVDPDWPSIPYGMPLTSQSMHVLGPDLEPRPTWVPGEIHIGGVGVALGYRGEPELTAASFYTHPRTGERMYRTGDMGRFLPGGVMEFLGRRDLQVKVAGHRIELGEIDTAVERHPSVRAAVSAAVGDRMGPRRLVTYVLLEPGQNPGPDELRAFVADTLPAHMIPSAFVPVTSLPLTANGKVDRKALVAAAPPPEPERAGRDAGTPRSATEERIARVVGSLLGTGAAVDADTPLVSLGASSVQLIRLAILLERELGHRPEMAEFLALHTVAAIAAYYDRAATGSAPRPAGGVLGRSFMGQASLELVDPDKLTAFLAEQHGVRRVAADAPRVALPGPAVDAALRERYRTRRSHRHFSPRPVTQAQLGQLLSALRQITVDGAPRYLYGSAHDSRSLQAYLTIKPQRVAGLEGGAYYYHPVAHELVRLAADNRDWQDAHVLRNRPMFVEAAFAIFLVAHLPAIVPLHGDDSVPYALIEAGLICQLLEMTAPSQGLGLCQIGAVDFAIMKPLFSLGDDSLYLHSLLGGGIAVEEGEL